MDKVYKKVEVVGVSDSSFADATRSAVRRAAETIDDISWFEVSELRGAVSGGEIKEFQVTVKLGFKVNPGD